MTLSDGRVSTGFLKALLAEFYWTTGLDVDKEEVIRRWRGLEEAIKSGDRSPHEPHDSLITDQVRDLTDPEARKRLVLQNSLLLLAQLKAGSGGRERVEEFLAKDFFPIFHGTHDAYGLISASESGGITILLRQSDQLKLTDATTWACAAISSRRSTFGLGVNASGDEVTASPKRIRIETRFDDVVLFTVMNEKTQVGSVRQLNSATRTALRALFASPPTSLLGLSGLAFTLLSVVFFVAGDGSNSWNAWFDGLFGRLATAAFGAQLITAANEFTALRRLTRGLGTRNQHGVLIDWNAAR